MALINKWTVSMCNSIVSGLQYFDVPVDPHAIKGDKGEFKFRSAVVSDLRKAFGSRSSEVDRHGSTIQLSREGGRVCATSGGQKLISVCIIASMCGRQVWYIDVKKTAKLQQCLRLVVQCTRRC